MGKKFRQYAHRKPSPSPSWETISVPVGQPAYGTTSLLLMHPLGHQIKFLIYQDFFYKANIFCCKRIYIAYIKSNKVVCVNLETSLKAN